MGKHRTQLSREQVVARMKQAKIDEHIVIGSRVSMMVCTYVLWDYFDMSREDMNVFIDKCVEFLDAYNEGRIDMDECLKILKDEVGIDMLGEWSTQTRNP